MTTLEIIVAIIAPLVALSIFLITMLINITTRLAKLETNMNLMLQWVACLNGEISDKTEYKKFLKKLKRVSKEKFGEVNCGK
jgi:hypothetical protein